MAKKPTKRTQPPRRPTKPAHKALAFEEYIGRLAALDGVVLTDTPGVSWQTFNDTLRAAIATDAGRYAAVVDTELRMRGWPDGGEDIEIVCGHIRTAIELGFRMALARYREHLEHVPELQRRRDTATARSQAGNASKRKAPVAVGGRTMPREERDAAMTAEYVALLKLMKPTPACQLLADKYGFESWQGVDSAIKRFRKRAGQ